MYNKEQDITDFLDAAEEMFLHGYWVNSPLQEWAKKRRDDRDERMKQWGYPPTPGVEE